MPYYMIATIDIHDREEYGKYEAGFLDVFSRYAGELVAVSDAPDPVEGEWPHTRAVLLRFPDVEEARRWHQSTDYQNLAQHRYRASTSTIIGLQGFEAPG